MDLDKIQGMMNDEDQRVKDLQSLAWSLQSLTNKPGARIPEDFKREAYKLASKAIALCSDVAYTEEADFVERSKIFWSQIEAKKIECAEVEEAEKQKRVGKCYKASSGGGYTVGSGTDYALASCTSDKLDPALRSAAQRRIDADSGSGTGRALSSTAGGARMLVAGELTVRLSQDPEALNLCNVGLGDGDIETLCKGLQEAGGSLTLLDVSHNHLADVGVQRLVSALAAGACPSLKELHIGFNSFGELGSQMLTGGLAMLRRSLVVYLDVGTAPDGWGSLEHALPVGAESISAHLERLSLPQDGTQELAPLSASAADLDARTAETSPAAVQSCIDGAGATTGTSDLQSAMLQSSAASAPDGDAIQVDLVPDSQGDGVEVRIVLSVPEGVNSAADLAVDVSARRIVAKTVTGALIADAALLCAVMEDTAQAKFSRKRRTMTIMLQPADPAAAAAAAAAAESAAGVH